MADNWDEEDVDVLIGKVQVKPAEAHKKGEEDVDEVQISTSTAHKAVKKTGGKVKEEEKVSGGNDVFS